MTDLPERLRRLSERGNERGADAVFAAAQATPEQAGRATSGLRTSFATSWLAAAAALLVVAGVAGAVVIDGEKNPTVKRPALAAGATTTTAGPTTTTSQLPPAPATPKIYLASTRMVPFNSCPSLASYAKQRALDTVGPYGLPYPGGNANDLAARRASGAPAAADGAAAGQSAQPLTAAPEFSGTNVQEAGIDEPDSVKTDGRTIFAVSGTKVFATRAGDNPALIGSIDVPGAQDLLLVGTKLVVISNGGAYATDARGGPAMDRAMIAGPYYPQPSRIAVYDVTNPAAMKFTGSLDVEGSYLSARVVDGVARIAVRSYPKLAFTYPADGSPEAHAAAVAHNRDVIRATGADTWLPHFTATNAKGQAGKSEALTACGDSYRPPAFSGFGMLSLVTFNLDRPGDSHATSVMADGQIVYASGTRMFIATNAWSGVDNNTVEPAPTTLVHAFDITDATDATYLGSGKVRGTVLNQFSLSERNGLLRIATTDPTGGSESFLTVLQNNGEALVPIGEVGGLGHGERIYGVRFIDDAAYVVTFRQVDPLYVVDLSDPTKPTVKGELKITGYSAYLHPLGPGRLLGIGQEATPEGRRAGVQASIFDVSDPTAPKLVTRTVVGGNSYTNAEYNHHAFLYWAPLKLAVLPLSVYSESEQFNGAIGLRIEDAGIGEIGRMQPPAQNGYSPGIERNVVIGDRLYAVSYAGVLVNTLELKSTAWIPYPSA